MWPNQLLLDLHAIYVYVDFSNSEEGETLREIIILVGVGLIETAQIRYAAIIDQLKAIPSTVHKDIGSIYELFAMQIKT